MRLFSKVPKLNIMGKMKYGFIISAIVLVGSAASYFSKGISYGIDFSGGTLIQIKFQDDPDLPKIRTLFQDKIKTNVNITTFGDAEGKEVLITLSQEAVEQQNGDLSSFVTETLTADFSGFDIRRVETVGPKVGEELKTKAFQAALYALIGILIYVGFRFHVRYGLAAVVALFHDVIITMGILILFEREFTLTIVAALLTIIGYSLNDTIVVFDRIRENVARMPRTPLLDVINQSVNESLSRTVLTSVTTFIVVFSLFIFGGEIIHDFSLAMLVGIVVGTFSSVFVASPVVYHLNALQLKKK